MTSYVSVFSSLVRQYRGLVCLRLLKLWSVRGCSSSLVIDILFVLRRLIPMIHTVQQIIEIPLLPFVFGGRCPRYAGRAVSQRAARQRPAPLEEVAEPQVGAVTVCYVAALGRLSWWWRCWLAATKLTPPPSPSSCARTSCCRRSRRRRREEGGGRREEGGGGEHGESSGR